MRSPLEVCLVLRSAYLSSRTDSFHDALYTKHDLSTPSLQESCHYCWSTRISPPRRVHHSRQATSAPPSAWPMLVHGPLAASPANRQGRERRESAMNLRIMTIGSVFSIALGVQLAALAADNRSTVTNPLRGPNRSSAFDNTFDGFPTPTVQDASPPRSPPGLWRNPGSLRTPEETIPVRQRRCPARRVNVRNGRRKWPRPADCRPAAPNPDPADSRSPLGPARKTGRTAA